jgi:hypothetical protein
MLECDNTNIDFENCILKGNSGSTGIVYESTYNNTLRSADVTEKIRKIAETCEYGVSGFTVYSSFCGSMGTFAMEKVEFEY